tara:strand:- start:6398 stop:6958 length:561 start_codon:yes stop_codon:yes gene_type:complete
MNKKLEDTFDLPSMEEALENAKDKEQKSESKEKVEKPADEKVIEELKIKKALTTAEKIDRALPQVKDLETHDEDMDVYSDEAMKSYKELMDLGMNSEARHAGKMFEVAATMLKNAVESKNAKADKKLRMIELQLKKQRVDQWDKRDDKQDEVIEGEGYVVGDRNKLLDQLIQKVQETDSESDKEDK